MKPQTRRRTRTRRRVADAPIVGAPQQPFFFFCFFLLLLGLRIEFHGGPAGLVVVSAFSLSSPYSSSSIVYSRTIQRQRSQRDPDPVFLRRASSTDDDVEESDDDDDNQQAPPPPPSNDGDDPRAFQKQMREIHRIRQEQLDAIVRKTSNSNNKNNGAGGGIASKNKPSKKETVQKIRQGQAASKAMDLPEQPLVKTIPGGTSTIFAMARRMAADPRFPNPVQEQEYEYGTWSSSSSSSSTSGDGTVYDDYVDDGAMSSPKQVSSSTSTTTAETVLPRWHPTPGISDSNPRFRTEPPRMTSQGYAATIWRHARKRRKAAMWRYAVRTFDRIAPGGRRSVHYEGALAACAKLGWGDRALELHREVVARKESSANNHRRGAVHVTDTMVTLLLRACVRQATQTNCRAPLDSVRDILLQAPRASSSSSNNMQLTTVHWNPLAAAYQKLGYGAVAKELLWEQLGDRIGGSVRAEAAVKDDPELLESGGDNDGDQSEGFNVHDVQAKDHGSYAIAISGAVQEQDWAAAVDRLRDMTETARLYPRDRHLNAWSEIAERQTRHRFARSWKKKREAALLEESLQASLVELNRRPAEQAARRKRK